MIKIISTERGGKSEEKDSVFCGMERKRKMINSYK